MDRSCAPSGRTGREASSQPPEGSARSRLDPFALPSATTLRFILLVAAVVGTSTFAFNFLYLALAPEGSGELGLYLRCQARAGQLPAGGITGGVGTAVKGFADCVAPFELAKAWWIVAGVVFLLLVAYLITWWRPAYKIWRGRLRPLTAEDASELVGYLDELVHAAGLRRAPVFLADLSARAPGGLAFGRPGRYYVLLNAGLITKFVTDRAGFRAVVMHEIAHLRNGDVTKAYLTVAIWWSFVAVALVPLAVVLIGEKVGFTAALTWRLLVLVAFVYLTRNAVLRAREIYADVRACSIEGDHRALSEVLAQLPRPAGPAWRRLLRPHPDPAIRAAAVDEPDVLFRGSFWEAAGAGLAATIAFGNLETLLWLMFGGLDALTARWLVALMFAPLAAGVAGIAAWRTIQHALVRGLPPTRATAIVGTGLGLGLLLGGPLSLPSAVTGSWGPLGGLGLSAGMVAALLLIALGALVVGWTAATARAWLPTVPDRSLRRECLVATVAASALLSVWLGVYMLLVDLYPAMPTLTGVSRASHAVLGQVAWTEPFWLWAAVDHPVLGYLIERNVLVLGLVLAWLVPLAAWYWPRARVTAAGRAPRLRLAVAAGLAGGFGYGILVLGLRALVHRWYPEATRMRPEFALLFDHWQVALAVLIQVVIAVMVAALVTAGRGPLAVILGLVAAFVAGTIMTALLLGAIVVGGCADALSIVPGPCSWTASTSFVRLTARQVLVLGSLAALPAAFIGAATGSLLRSRAARSWPPASAPFRAAAQPPSRSLLFVPLGACAAALLVLLTGSALPQASSVATQSTLPRPSPVTPLQPTPTEQTPVQPQATPAQLAPARLDAYAKQACEAYRQMRAGAGTLGTGELQDLLITILNDALHSDNQPLQEAAAGMGKGIADSNPQDFARNARRLNSICGIVGP
jgi:Zn-dependent protease with chaperone function